MTTTVENLKNEISDCYIKDLKKQLWWLKSIAVLPIQKPIKDILMWKGEMPEKFDEVKEFWWRKNIINFVSPQVATEIFEFMKSKRLEIEKKFYQNYDFESSDKSKQESSGILGKIRNFLEQDL